LVSHGLKGARLHHVGYLVADISDAAQRLVDAFGYVVETEVIADPAQTASVQFLRLAADSVWLELVSPLGSPSKLDAALRRGEGMHHLCFEVKAIEDSVDSLQRHALRAIAPILPAVAFGGRRIAWLTNSSGMLFELVEQGRGPLRLEDFLTS
jgi:methylmalonyl-CoA/ethylmalonyl-CoA epimerase